MASKHGSIFISLSILSALFIVIMTDLSQMVEATCAIGDYLTPAGCHPCEVGHRCNGTIKEKCPPGTAQAFQGRNKCYECETGYFQSKEGSIQCERCPSGHYCASKTVNATACPPGYSMFSTGATECSPCLKGYYQTKAGEEECQICPSGHACPDTINEPQPCPMGTIQFFPGATQCRDCSPGYFQDREGQLQCKRCEPGYFCPNVTQDQIPCDVGTFMRDSGAIECENCSVGTYQNQTQQQACISCPVGHFCPSVNGIPIPCSPGEYQGQIEQNHCEKCPEGYYQMLYGQAECLPCPKGHSCTDVTKCPEPCPQGTEQPYEGHANCEVCPKREDNTTCPTSRVVNCENCTVFHFKCDVEKRSVRVNPEENMAAIQQHVVQTFGLIQTGTFQEDEEGVFIALQASLLETDVEELRAEGVPEVTILKLAPYLGKDNATLASASLDPEDLELTEEECLKVSGSEIREVSSTTLNWGSYLSQKGRNVLGVFLHWVPLPEFLGLKMDQSDPKIVVSVNGEPRNFIWETIEGKSASDEELLIAIKRTKRYHQKLSEPWRMLRKQYKYLGGKNLTPIFRSVKF